MYSYHSLIGVTEYRDYKLLWRTNCLFYGTCKKCS